MVEMPRRVRVYEVGPRDGLQNEAASIPTATKQHFIELLVAAGLREIEATSFVSPRVVPRLADENKLLPPLPRPEGMRSPVLVANARGLARAGQAGARAMAVFTAASDAFTQRNIGLTVAESLATYGPLIHEAGHRAWWTRGYVSTAFGCPYTGRVDPARAIGVALALLELGVDEVCFGDTIGVAVPSQVHDLTGGALAAGVPLGRLAYHFHDTRGTALANVVAGLEDGEAVARACRDPEIRRWIPTIPEPYTIDDAVTFIERVERDWAEGHAAAFAIVESGDSRLLGAITIHGPRDRRAFVGYWVAPWARRRGVATRALRLVSRWAMREMGLVRLALYTLEGNVGSQVVAERCGFGREGVLRNYDDGGDCVMFSLVPADLAGE